MFGNSAWVKKKYYINVRECHHLFKANRFFLNKNSLHLSCVSNVPVTVILFDLRHLILTMTFSLLFPLGGIHVCNCNCTDSLHCDTVKGTTGSGASLPCFGPQLYHWLYNLRDKLLTFLCFNVLLPAEDTKLYSHLLLPLSQRCLT